jgi:putative aldouronate transport system substrate-binding protein
MEVKTMKKLICLIICVTMLITVFAGCEKKPVNDETEKTEEKVDASSNNVSEKESTEATETEKQEPLEIYIVNRIPRQSFDPENNVILRAIEEKYNVIFEYEAPPDSSYMERVNVIMASGELPDIVQIPDASLMKYAEDGLLLELNGYIENSPNIKEKVPAESFKMASSQDGKIYALPRCNRVAAMGALIRTDWLDNVGLKVPETVDEFMEVMRAFTQDDPDKDGEDDTYGVGLMFNKANTNIFPDFLLSGFGITKATITKNAYDEVTIMAAQKGFLPLLDLFREMASKKFIDPEWYLNLGTTHLDDFHIGKVGMVAHNMSAGAVPKQRGLLKEASGEDAEMEYILPLKNEKGIIEVSRTAPYWGAWSITTGCEDPERTMEFLDNMYSDEGMLFSYLGIQGVTYESYDSDKKTVVRTPEQQKVWTDCGDQYLPFNAAWADGSPITMYGNTPEEIDEYINNLDKYHENVAVTFADSYLKLPEYTEVNEVKPMIESELSSMVVRYIMSEIERSEIEDYLNNEYIPAYKTLIDAMQ